MTAQPKSHKLARRSVLGILTAAAAGGLSVHASGDEGDASSVSEDMIQQTQWLGGLELSEEQQAMAADALADAQDGFHKLRSQPIDHGTAPAVVFQPLEPTQRPIVAESRTADFSETVPPEKPDTDEDLAFMPVSELSALLRHRKISSGELTKIYLQRLAKFDSLLKCVVARTDELALRQAQHADREIAAGRYRGPLHGIPWGAKDLIAYPGYTTTWGAPLLREQQLDYRAAVAQRLDAAGCVLTSKLSLGSYAAGDQWFGGKTRNPWNPSKGSSGSSAGSASAVVAGLTGFTIGTETMGSITSPSRRCGATGLRPTFGRVSRYGCMTLSWSLDKLGPITRSVEDCAVVFAAIHGADRRDPGSVQRPFHWPPVRGLESLRVGYLEKDTEKYETELQVLRDLGVKLTPIQIPANPHSGMLNIILTAEASSVFDELTRNGEPKGVKFWPKTFAMGQFVLANDYLRANRIRRQLMTEMDTLMQTVNVIVGPSMMNTTNMTGHPQVVLPNGFRKQDDLDVPTSLTFTGQLNAETDLLAVADAYQKATGHHLARPPIDDFLEETERFHSESDLLDSDRLYDC